MAEFAQKVLGAVIDDPSAECVAVCEIEDSTLCLLAHTQAHARTCAHAPEEGATECG